MISGHLRIISQLLFVNLIILVTIVWANDEVDETLAKENTVISMEVLLQKFSSYTEYSSHFIESKHLDSLDLVLEIEGELFFKHPDYLKRISYPPYKETVEVSANQVRRTRADGESQTIDLQQFPEIESFVAAYRATLAGDELKLKEHYLVKLEGNLQDWRLELKPKGDKLKAWLEDMILLGEENKIKRIEIYEMNGDKRLIQLNNHHHD